MEVSKKNKEDISTQNNFDQISNSLFSVISIDWIRYKTKKISNSIEEGKNLWLNIKAPVPIYYLEWSWWSRKWAYVKEKGIIFMFDNADGITLKHEIIHSIEYNKTIPDTLFRFYDLVKIKILEKSFDGEVASFNFMKNIHEFIADGYSKQPFINALKKEWFYEKFLKETEYIFE